MFTLRPRLVTVLVPLAALGAASPLLFGRFTQDRVRPLRPGRPIQVEHPLDAPAPVFRIDVPDYATALHIWTEAANADVGMLVTFEQEPDPEDPGVGVSGSDAWVDEDVWIHVTDLYNLAPGPWYVTLPVHALLGDGTGQSDVRYTLNCELITPERVPLPLNVPVTVRVPRNKGLLAAFSCEVNPTLVQAGTLLRLEVVSDDADVDVLAGPYPAGSTYWNYFALGDSDLGFERIRFSAHESGRRFGVLAYALPELDPFREIELTVLLTLDEPDSPTLKPSPRIPSLGGATPLVRAMNATVAVFGPHGAGSGVVISPWGHVLTNAHVVTGAGDNSGEFAPLAIAFDLDRISPALPSLGAHIVEYRQDLDIALLRIDSDLLGAPLPAEVRFPHLELRPTQEPPQLGDELWCMGYPMTGGSNSFVTLSVTRGVLSGYSQELEGLQYKVDAQIHSGMSGGACIDAQGRLVGLPSASLSDFNQAGGLGFVIPAANVPGAWRSHWEDKR